MKQTLPHRRSTARAGSAVALGLLANLTLLSIAHAKPGNGNGGGGGGDDEPTDPDVTIIDPPPFDVPAPILQSKRTFLEKSRIALSGQKSIALLRESHRISGETQRQPLWDLSELTQRATSITFRCCKNRKHRTTS